MTSHIIISGLPETIILPKLIFILRSRLKKKAHIKKFWVKDVSDEPGSNLRSATLEFYSLEDAYKALQVLNGYEYICEGQPFPLKARPAAVDGPIQRPTNPQNNREIRYGSIRNNVEPDRYNDRRHMRSRSRSPLCDDPRKRDLELELLHKKRMIIEEERKLLIEKKKLELLRESENLGWLERNRNDDLNWADQQLRQRSPPPQRRPHPSHTIPLEEHKPISPEYMIPHQEYRNPPEYRPIPQGRKAFSPERMMPPQGRRAVSPEGIIHQESRSFPQEHMMPPHRRRPYPQEHRSVTPEHMMPPQERRPFPQERNPFSQGTRPVTSDNMMPSQNRRPPLFEDRALPPKQKPPSERRRPPTEHRPPTERKAPRPQATAKPKKEKPPYKDRLPNFYSSANMILGEMRNVVKQITPKEKNNDMYKFLRIAVRQRLTKCVGRLRHGMDAKEIVARYRVTHPKHTDEFLVKEVLTEIDQNLSASQSEQAEVRQPVDEARYRNEDPGHNAYGGGNMNTYAVQKNAEYDMNFDNDGVQYGASASYDRQSYGGVQMQK